MLIDGIHVPLTEPFYRDGALYLRKLEHNVRRYSLSPVSGLVVLPPDGEASSLSDQETTDVFETVVAVAGAEKVLVAGVARDSVHSTLALAEAAAAAAFDAVLIAAPRNLNMLAGEKHAEMLKLFFLAVADAAPLPIMLWSGSAQSASGLSVDLIAELSSHANIIGAYCVDLSAQMHSYLVQETSNYRREVEVTTVFTPVTRRMRRVETQGPATFVSADALGGGAALAVASPKPALKTRTKTVGFQIMSAGRVSGLVELLQAGVAGAAPRLTASAPQATYEVFAAFKDGDPALAAEKAKRLELADQLVQELGPEGVKYGCDLSGYFGGLPRLPRLPLTAEQRSRVEAAFYELRN